MKTPLIRSTLVHLKAFGSDTLFAYDGPLACSAPSHGDDTRENQLELIFRQCNHVDGNEWIAGRKLRSLSVGDQVIFILSDGAIERWEVMGTGFARVENVR